MRCTDIQLKATHLICSPGSNSRDFQPLPETRHEAADAMLRFSDPMTFNRTPGQMGRGEKGKEGMAGMIEGPVPFQKLSTGQWTERKRQFQFLSNASKDARGQTQQKSVRDPACLRFGEAERRCRTSTTTRTPANLTE